MNDQARPQLMSVRFSDGGEVNLMFSKDLVYMYVGCYFKFITSHMNTQNTTR